MVSTITPGGDGNGRGSCTSLDVFSKRHATSIYLSVNEAGQTPRDLWQPAVVPMWTGGLFNFSLTFPLVRNTETSGRTKGVGRM